ncbi:patatin-like phospholipase family protein [Caulobacter endophyticus]|uniref:PNPLA domain-containing protein n=1 Tax=Caulobacter endophyticus TaxID=2172652 RepID=A0A2T9K2T5_9CAUL|nr:patatin-like phospholipase family protein [Caulobacter endophyticus]PVM90296.1 hypothetical protein DDF67_10220 [Caulobacter endophyticus]
MADANTKLRKAGLVFQGGGALGAFELGVARAIYGPHSRFEPDVISGVSIGSINAVLLARPARSMTGLQALESFWRDVAVNHWLSIWLGASASSLGVPGFYSPDLPWLPSRTSLYDIRPLIRTLQALVDFDGLADPSAQPQLMLGTINIETGKSVIFDSREKGLELKHILASASLPPSFPGVSIDGKIHWDGGIFDNTPLGAVIEHLDAPDPEILVVNLFPNENPPPTTLAEVSQVLTNILFANKTDADLRLMEKFNAVADLLDFIDRTFPDSEIHKTREYALLRRYRRVPKVLNVNRTATNKASESSDFSRDGIQGRAREGERLTRIALRDAGLMEASFANTEG